MGWYIIFVLAGLIPAIAASQLLPEPTGPASIVNSNRHAGGRSLSAAAASQVSLEEDRQALDSWAHLLRDDVLVQRWQNESTTSTPCDWTGVHCGDWQGELRVVGLNFSGLDLAGPMPHGLGKISALRSLVVGGCHFYGTVPADIGNCSNLEVLDISFNVGLSQLPGEIFAGCQNLRVLNGSQCGFQGAIPKQLWSSTNIEEINLADNNFTGDLAIGTGRRLSNLTKLDLSRNQLSGEIADIITAIDCTKLAHIDLTFNKFAGVIPPRLRKCTQLRYIMFHGNRLTGSVPEELGELQHLECLGLGENYLTGTLPMNLLKCRRLWAIDVSHNGLSEAIPRWLSEMPSLRYFTAHTNKMSGQIPRELGRAPQLAHFDVGHNNLSGIIPPELGNVTTFRFLRLARNHLVSSLPPSLGNLSQLRGLDVSGNDLSGPVPPSFGSLHNLRWLHLEENRLNGSIPRELTNCRSMLWLNVRNNRLSGEIPPDIYSLGNNDTTSFFTKEQVDDYYPPTRFGYCSLISIWVPEKYSDTESLLNIGLVNDAYCRKQWVDRVSGKNSPILIFYWQFSYNSLSGRIPAPVRKTPHLLCLMLSHNALTGSIPANLSLVPLLWFDISANGVTGSIPDIFGAVAMTLDSLDLSENKLEGRLPASLNRLSFLMTYNFSYNPALEGPVPFERSFQFFNPSAYLNNSQLCRVRDPHTMRKAISGSLMRYCEDVSTKPASESEVTKLSGIISIHAFALGAGAGFYLMWIVCEIYGFTAPPRPAHKRRRDNRVGVWRPPT